MIGKTLIQGLLAATLIAGAAYLYTRIEPIPTPANDAQTASAGELGRRAIELPHGPNDSDRDGDRD